MTDPETFKQWVDSLPDPEFVKQWVISLFNRGRSQHTITAYRRAVLNFMIWSSGTDGGNFIPGQMIERDIKDWKGWQLTVKKQSAATVNQRLVAVSEFYEWACDQNLARNNPTKGVTGVPPAKRKIKSLDESEYRRLLRQVHGTGNLRDIAMVEMLGGTGLRVGELLALKVGDVEITPRAGMVTVRMGKHGNHREVPLPLHVRQALDQYLAEHPGKNKPEAELWIGQRGTLKGRSAVLRMLEKYAIAARLKAFGPHTLRHTFAARYLVANPGDLRGLAALLGHASINTTMIYTEPALGDLANRMEKVDNGTG